MAKLTKKKIKAVLQYAMMANELEMLKGIRDGFVFNIRPQIEWIDSLPGHEFHSKHYSPLIHEPIPILKRGTNAYDDFWDEQDRRCIEGYAPVVNGVKYARITGPHYFYLNMFQIMMLKENVRKKELDYPYYRVLDHHIFLELEKAAKDGYGIIVGKARRMGLSYIGAVMILWDMIFHQDAEVAVGAGIESKAMLLYDKIHKSLQNIREEYRVSFTKTKSKLRLVYQVVQNRNRIDKGIRSQLDVATFFSKESALEGGSYSFVIFEEIGIFLDLIKSYKSTEPCFMEGGIQFGVPFLFGTGGEVDKGSKDFKIIWGNPRSYNLKKLFIPGYMYYPGSSSNENDEDYDEMDAKVNFFDIRTGMTDEKKALKHIMERRVRSRKSKEGYIKEVQARPIKESDLFLKTSGGLLNRIALAAQRESIFNKENKHTWVRGSYKWKDTDAIQIDLARARNTKEKNLVRIKYNIGVEFVEDPDGTAYKLVGFNRINDDRMPYKADIVGTDSYDEEQVVESGSLGCSIVYRCFNGMSQDYDLPISFISERGDGSSEDTFYDNTLKQCVFWNAENLIEYTKISILNYYKDVNAHNYLRENPSLRDDIVTNRGKQEYGVRMTSGIKGFKALVTTLLKLEVKDNIQNYHFEKIIDDLIEYGDKNTDIAMALGVCLIHKLDLFDYISEDLENEVDSGDVLMDMASYGTDENGKLIITSYNEGMNLDKMETWDPRLHLEGEKRANYLTFVAATEEKKKNEREKKEQAYVESQRDVDPFTNTINDFLKNKE